mmetsp:Transcript_33108/g.105679  ORF Transcript_33108/g.105679 Transcript_33108/m.105679 type:complete len:84 (+) Transcript_33108:1041-1292(+)
MALLLPLELSLVSFERRATSPAFQGELNLLLSEEDTSDCLFLLLVVAKKVTLPAAQATAQRVHPSGATTAAATRAATDETILA